MVPFLTLMAKLFSAVRNYYVQWCIRIQPGIAIICSTPPGLLSVWASTGTAKAFTDRY